MGCKERWKTFKGPEIWRTSNPPSFRTRNGYERDFSQRPCNSLFSYLRLPPSTYYYDRWRWAADPQVLKFKTSKLSYRSSQSYRKLAIIFLNRLLVKSSKKQDTRLWGLAGLCSFYKKLWITACIETAKATIAQCTLSDLWIKITRPSIHQLLIKTSKRATDITSVAFIKTYFPFPVCLLRWIFLFNSFFRPDPGIFL